MDQPIAVPLKKAACGGTEMADCAHREWALSSKEEEIVRLEEDAKHAMRTQWSHTCSTIMYNVLWTNEPFLHTAVLAIPQIFQ